MTFFLIKKKKKRGFNRYLTVTLYYVLCPPGLCWLDAGGKKEARIHLHIQQLFFQRKVMFYSKKKKKKKFKNPQKTPTNIWPYSTYLINVLTISTLECPTMSVQTKLNVKMTHLSHFHEMFHI